MATEFPIRFGKYVLLRKLAVGGMAEVFLAKAVGAQGFQRTVVIKRILPSYSEDEAFVTMFIDEARIAAALHHANIIQIIDFDKVDDSYYIAMEYVEGRDLRKVLDRGHKEGRRMTPVLAAHVASLIAAGLHYAHTRRSETGEPLNIIHRDVSPHNILLSFVGDVKITDFGIAKAAARSTKTRAGTVKGKCAYMSPEQAKGKPLDARSDVFALSAVLWEMLAGRRLFEGDSDFEILNSVLNQPLCAPSTLNPQVPPELDSIVLKGLQRDLYRRYPDMGALEKDLQNFVFRNASGRDEVDVGAYLRDLFADEVDRIPEYSKESSSSARKRAADSSPRAAEPPPQGATMVLSEEEAEPPQQQQAPERAKTAPTTVPVGMLRQELEQMLAKGTTTSPAAEGMPEPQEPNASSGGKPGEPPPTVALSEREIRSAITGAMASPEPEWKAETTGRLQVGTGSRSRVQTRGSSRIAMWVLLGLLGVAVVSGGLYFATSGESGPETLRSDARDAGPIAVAPGGRDPGPAVTAADTSQHDAGIAVQDAGPPAERVAAEIEFEVKPRNATLRVNGKPVEVQDGRAVLAAAQHVGDEILVEAEAPGYVAFRNTIRIQRAREQVPVTLAKKAERPAGGPAETGFVSLNARPWADVYYRGRKIGTTPVSRFEVPVGRQTFILRNKTTTREVTVTVEKGQTAIRIIDM